HATLGNCPKPVPASAAVESGPFPPDPAAPGSPGGRWLRGPRLAPAGPGLAPWDHDCGRPWRCSLCDRSRLRPALAGPAAQATAATAVSSSSSRCSRGEQPRPVPRGSLTSGDRGPSAPDLPGDPPAGVLPGAHLCQGPPPFGSG